MGHVIAITRYRVPIEDAKTFTEQVDAVLRTLAAYPGYRSGRLGRTVDDPTLWALITEWDGAGFYRRAIGGYDVRVLFIPLSVLAIDEPGAYEIVPTASGDA
jgi:antibiotic biosynthesis monooxygenase